VHRAFLTGKGNLSEEIASKITSVLCGNQRSARTYRYGTVPVSNVRKRFRNRIRVTTRL